MSIATEILVEGTYQYFEKDLNISQEVFKLVHHPETQIYQFNAEILSRMETGEFLKIIVRYELNHHFAPQSLRIEKSIGSRYAMETYRIDHATMELFYNFQNSTSAHEFKKTVSSKHYLVSPALCATGLFTLTKKFNAQQRTPVTFISSDNNWTFEGNPTEKIIFAEYKSRDVADYQIQGNTLPASHLCLFDVDSSQSSQEDPVEIYLSRHYGIPYQMKHGDLNIVIKNLRKNN